MTGIRAGAEPWFCEGGETGVLVLHGFTGSPHSMRPLAEAFAGAGCTVSLPLLPGHGTVVGDLVPTRWDDWLAAAEDACAELVARCERVVVCGLSMGGTLSTWLAAHHGEIVGALVVNPLIEPPAASVRDLFRQMVESGTELIPGIGSDIAKPDVPELSYDATPLAPLLSLFEATDRLVPDLGRVRCPVLLFSSRQDHVVPPSSGDLLVARVGGPIERVWLEHSYHVATLDHDAPEIEAGAVRFVAGIAAG